MTTARQSESITLAQFLATVPPSQARSVIASHKPLQRTSTSYDILLPDIELHCEKCGGTRSFYIEDEHIRATLDDNDWTYEHIRYECRNCRKVTKNFSIAVKISTRPPRTTPPSTIIECIKLGELPAFGPVTPSKLLTLIGPDKDLFLKGRRCEVHGLGIGAFTYYRRVVENQKGRIIDHIIDAAKTLGTPEEVIATLRKAKEERQFKTAVGLVKDAIPQSLLIDGHNPLTLLHSAMSEVIHADTDERCMAMAQTIRLVLVELSDRLSQALKDKRELHEAVSRLRQKRV